MANGLTELVFILDKSGSMAGLEKDTIGGYNAVLQKQQRIESPCFVTTVLFAHDYVVLHDRVDIHGVQPMTEKDYCVGGSTALLDAVGRTIHRVAHVQQVIPQEYRPQKVLFVIITDGEENSSREYSTDQVKKLIADRQAEDGWEFVFLGANIDAVASATALGIASDRAQNYHPDAAGVELNFQTLDTAVTALRENAAMPVDWNAAIQADYAQRKRRK